MRSLETVLKRDQNNFDLVRLFAALTIIVVHSFELFISPGYANQYVAVLFKGLAIDVFFLLSGIYITASFVNSKNYISFIILRIFRLLPALIICTVITVFIIGASVTTLPLKGYFKDIQTWRYLIYNSLLFRLQWFLPGVFKTNHFPASVNGSLWTLALEIKCYSIVFLLGCLKIFNRKFIILLVILGSLGLYYFLPRNTYLFNFLDTTPFIFFVSGVLLYVFKEHVFLDYKICFIALLICLFFYNTHAFTLMLHYALTYCIIVIGVSAWFKKIRLPGDYSYGVYIYGFLVQQTIYHLLPGINYYKGFIITLPIVLVLGYLSWNYMEHPSILLGRKLAKITIPHSFLRFLNKG